MYYNNKYIVHPFSMDDEPPAKEEPKGPEMPGMQPPFAREFEKIFIDQRKVFFWGEVNEKNCREVVTKLLYLDANKQGEEIKLYINSPGGSVTEGMVVYDTIRMLPSPVSTICMGMSASMGALLLSAGVKGRRFIFPHSEVMIHQPALGGYYQATVADLEIQARQIKKTKELSGRILSENCGQPLEKVMQDLERDYWMNAQEAIAYGIVDGVVEKI
jgi:ATP-dependent Clp protease, protease subunit